MSIKPKKHNKYESTIRLMSLIRHANKSGKCAVCHNQPMEIYPSGSRSMTCDNPVCKRAWLLPGHQEPEIIDDN